MLSYTPPHCSNPEVTALNEAELNSFPTRILILLPAKGKDKKVGDLFFACTCDLTLSKPYCQILKCKYTCALIGLQKSYYCKKIGMVDFRHHFTCSSNSFHLLNECVVCCHSKTIHH